MKKQSLRKLHCHCAMLLSVVLIFVTGLTPVLAAEPEEPLSGSLTVLSEEETNSESENEAAPLSDSNETMVSASKTQDDPSVSDNAVSDNAVSKNAVSENTVSENTASENTASENAPSENTDSKDIVSENTVSEDAASEEPPSDPSASENTALTESVSEDALSDNTVLPPSDPAAMEETAGSSAASVMSVMSVTAETERTETEPSKTDTTESAGASIMADGVALAKGEKVDLKTIYTLASGGRFVSDSPKIAAVNGKGILTGKKPGTANIRPQHKENGKWVDDDSTIGVKVFSSVFTQKSTVLTYVGQTYDALANLSTEYTPESWVSSKPGVATVDSSGKVTAVGRGTAKISAVYERYGINKVKVTMTVKVNVPVLSKKSVNVLTGAKVNIKLKNVPKDKVSSVKWQGTLAILGGKYHYTDCNFTAVAPGTGTIEAVLDGQTYGCPVTVKAPVLKTTAMAIKKGKSKKISIKNTKYKSSAFSYTSSNPTVAGVDSAGKVTAGESGTASISVTLGTVPIGTVDVTVP